MWSPTSDGAPSRVPAVRLALLLAVVAFDLTACGSHSAPTRTPLTIVVNAPFSRSPYLGRTIENGTRLGTSEVNAAGIRIGDTLYELRVRTMDTGLSPARAVANVRRATGQDAVAIGDEGTGIDASWRVARGVPVCVVFAGGDQVTDPVTRPDVFRIA